MVPFQRELDPISEPYLELFVDQAKEYNWEHYSLTLSDPSGKEFDFSPSILRNTSFYTIYVGGAGRYTLRCARSSPHEAEHHSDKV